MSNTEFQLPFKCGSDGTEWLAKLAPVGPRFGFVAFERPGQQVETPTLDRRDELRRRLDQLLSATTPPLPPPSSSDVVPRPTTTQLTYDQLTDFGFVCPSCANTRTLFCVVCKKFSCQGGGIDSAGRILCPWCGAVLVFGTRSAGGKEEPPLQFDVMTERTGIRNRELPSGNQP